MLNAEMGGKDSGADKSMSYFVQVSVRDDSGRDALTVLAESELGELTAQGAYLIPAEQKQQLLPASLNGNATVHCSLNSGAGGKPWEVSGPLSLLDGKKKQWLQCGFDPYGLRVQLHVLAEPDGSGFHLIHARVTPPPPCVTHRHPSPTLALAHALALALTLLLALALARCVLTLKFTPRKAGAKELLVRAKGRGVAAQTAFEVETLDSSVRVPKHCSASARLVRSCRELFRLCSALELRQREARVCLPGACAEAGVPPRGTASSPRGGDGRQEVMEVVESVRCVVLQL